MLGAAIGPGAVRGLDRDAVAPSPGAPPVRRVDLRDPVLATALSGVEVLVHCDRTPPGRAGSGDALDAEERYARDVHGTANLLAAAAAVGVRHLVLVSDATVYGARVDNPLPLDEACPLRATPRCPTAWQRRVVEDLVAAWAAEHPGIGVTVLRPATVLDPGADDALAAFLEAPVLLHVKGHLPPVQVLHPEDLGSAVAFVLDRGLTGVFDVAADGWVPFAEAARLLRRRPVAMGEAVAAAVLDRMWRWGASPVPGGGIGHLMHPWVLSTRPLRGHGWAPRHGNRETLRAFAAAHAGRVRLGPVATTYARIAALCTGAGAGAALLSGIAALAVYRRASRGT